MMEGGSGGSSGAGGGDCGLAELLAEAQRAQRAPVVLECLRGAARAFTELYGGAYAVCNDDSVVAVRTERWMVFLVTDCHVSWTAPDALSSGAGAVASEFAGALAALWRVMLLESPGCVALTALVHTIDTLLTWRRAATMAQRGGGADERRRRDVAPVVRTGAPPPAAVSVIAVAGAGDTAVQYDDDAVSTYTAYEWSAVRDAVCSAALVLLYGDGADGVDGGAVVYMAETLDAAGSRATVRGAASEMVSMLLSLGVRLANCFEGAIAAARLHDRAIVARVCAVLHAYTLRRLGGDGGTSTAATIGAATAGGDGQSSAVLTAFIAKLLSLRAEPAFFGLVAAALARTELSASHARAYTAALRLVAPAQLSAVLLSLLRSLLSGNEYVVGAAAANLDTVLRPLVVPRPDGVRAREIVLLLTEHCVVGECFGVAHTAFVAELFVRACNWFLSDGDDDVDGDDDGDGDGDKSAAAVRSIVLQLLAAWGSEDIILRHSLEHVYVASRVICTAFERLPRAHVVTAPAVTRAVLNGVQAYLDAPTAATRWCGMSVGTQYTRLLDVSHPLSFDLSTGGMQSLQALIDAEAAAVQAQATRVADVAAAGAAAAANRASPREHAPDSAVVAAAAPKTVIGGGFRTFGGSGGSAHGDGDGASGDVTVAADSNGLDGVAADFFFGSDDSDSDNDDIGGGGGDGGTVDTNGSGSSARRMHLHDCIAGLAEKEDKTVAEGALHGIAGALYAHAAQLNADNIGRSVARTLLNMGNPFGLADFELHRVRGLCACIVIAPAAVGTYVCRQFYVRNYTISQRAIMLKALAGAAVALSDNDGSDTGGDGAGMSTPKSQSKAKSKQSSPIVEIGHDLRRWGGAAALAGNGGGGATGSSGVRVGKANAFAPHAVGYIDLLLHMHPDSGGGSGAGGFDVLVEDRIVLCQLLRTLSTFVACAGAYTAAIDGALRHVMALLLSLRFHKHASVTEGVVVAMIQVFMVARDNAHVRTMLYGEYLGEVVPWLKLTAQWSKHEPCARAALLALQMLARDHRDNLERVTGGRTV